jgi:zinc transporter 7
VVQNLNIHHAASAPTSSSYTSQIFAFVFPSQSPAVNALLATLYISGPPNFLLALCPPNIDPSSLSIMVAFAVGGILGDTLFHLLPEIFLGENAESGVRFVMVEGNRNLLLGVAIMVGFMTFVALDKGLRIATGGSGGHDHSHSHSHSEEKSSAKTTGTDVSTATAKSRKSKSTKETAVEKKPDPSANPSIRLSAYLNLIADFTHNITDGLAMSSSFYASPTTGAITTMAVFFHEIPHEVGDFALLIQSGFSKRAAMLSQFITALGALLGTGIGIAVQEYGGNSSGSGAAGVGKVGYGGIWGTSLQWGDLLLPFTAGTFLYVGTVAVIPEMLETGPDKRREFTKMIKEFLAIAAGAGIMLA